MFIQQNKNLHILIFYPEVIPAIKYGGTERVVWDLAKKLFLLNYKITLLIKKGSVCPFGNVIFYNESLDINQQIPYSVDVVHCHANPKSVIKKPYIITVHGNPKFGELLDKNSVFVSRNHAYRYGSKHFVHNGLDWDNYLKPNFYADRNFYHFLANASWKVKNVNGAIKIAKQANEKLVVLGGYRFNIKMGIRITLDTHVSFKGMVDNEKKSKILNKSKGLIFPVLWHEPFGLAIIESLYFGCPIFGTNYGSLTELVIPEVGYLSNNTESLVKSIQNNQYNSKDCHYYAATNFSSEIMCRNYIKYYEKVLNNRYLNDTNLSMIENLTTKYLQFD